MAHDTDNSVTLERKGRVGWITLNRPAAMNAVSLSMLQRFTDVLDEIEGDNSIGATVITGAGSAFCSGADLKAMREFTESEVADAANADYVTRFGAAMRRLELFPKPVVAAINGVTVAGGLEIALCCDIVLAAAGARIGDGHMRYALMPGGGGSVRLPRRAGRAMAKYLLLTGALVPAEELVSCGLVLRVVTREQLAEETMAIAQTLAGRSPLALRRMKRLVDDGLEMPTDVALRHEHSTHAAHALSDDRREGLAAFVEKRPPMFSGR